VLASGVSGGNSTKRKWLPMVGRAYMAREFQSENSLEICRALNRELEGVSIQFEPHIEFKKRIPSAIGIIRMGTSLGMETWS